MIAIDQASGFVELKLLECGREICVPDKAIVFSEKPYHLFHYVTSGKGTFELNGITYDLHKGMLFYIPPESGARYAPDREDPWTYEWLGFSGAASKGFLTSCGISPATPVLSDADGISLKHYFDEIVNENAEKGYLDIVCLGLAYQLFGTIYNRSRSRVSPYSVKESHIQSAKDFIMNNFQFEIKIDDIAKNVGVTPNYLANIFTEMEHVSPKKYLTKVRMEKAVVLLRLRQYQIKEVALMVGYKNQLHFSSEFKKKYGISPLGFMKKETEK